MSLAFDWRQLVVASNYQVRANANRPADSPSMAAEIRRLVGTGLKPRDIAVALRIDLSTVLSGLAVSNVKEFQ